MAEVSRIACSDGVAYIGTTAGVYISRDTGRTWSECNTGFDTLYNIFAIAAHDSVVYASTSTGSLFRMRLGALTWTRVPLSAWVESVANIYVGDSVVVVASGTPPGGDYGTMFITTDAGATWEQRDSGLPARNIESFAVQSDRATGALVLFCGTAIHPKLFVSRDTGMTWQRVLDMNALLLFAHGRQLYAWLDPNYAGHADSAGLYASTDYGVSWVRADHGISSEGKVMSMGAIADTVLCETCDAGMFRSTDGGRYWEISDDGLYAAQIASIDTLGTVFLAGAVANAGGIQGVCSRYGFNIGCYVSSNGGASWLVRRHGMHGASVDDVALVQSTLVAACGYDGVWEAPVDSSNWINPREPSSSMYTSHVWRVVTRPGVEEVFANFHTSNFGSTQTVCWLFRKFPGDTVWNCSQNGLPTTVHVDRIVVDSLTDPQDYRQYLVADGSMYRTTDGGRFWHRIDSTGSALVSLFDVAVLPSSIEGTPAEILAPMDQGLMRSTDEGRTWRLDATLPNVGYPWFACVSDTTLYLSCDSGIYCSVDRGPWQKISNPTAGFANLSATVGRIFAFSGTTTDGAFWRRSVGDVWHHVSVGLPFSVGVNAVVASSTTLYLGTATDGIWSMPLADLDSVARVDEPVANFPTPELHLWPDPIRQGTGAALTIALPGGIGGPKDLAITNILGQRISFARSTALAPDARELHLDVSSLPPGTYFAVVRGTAFTLRGRFAIVE